uniref:DDE Tnp4 domain-containing protein n=1 Tax=Cacopsylla melanoneura TaxID=428564 RepID=A0A8D8SVQ7_9HEMI
MTWSAYKKCNTIKYLIACTPDGTCCFISEGWGGRTSDSVILKKSGFLDKIEPGVQIMADRGFKHVERDIAEKGASLVRPPSVVSTGPLCKSDARLTKQVASPFIPIVMYCISTTFEKSRLSIELYLQHQGYAT